MKPLVSLLAFLLAAFLPLSLCACRKNEDFLDVFRDGFTADIACEAGEFAFSGVLVADAAPLSADGSPLPFCGVFSFYAPESLSGTTLRRSADGSVSVCSGNLCSPVAESSPFYAVFDLFPVSASVTNARVDENRNTSVSGSGFSLSFLPSGAPVRAENTRLCATVLSFQGAR